MTHLVFVYGTLKEGFPNFHVNAGRRVAGEFVTAQSYPLYVIGSHPVPWLVDRAGEGHRVRGQVFAVDDATLARMDELELVDHPDWYARRTIDVVRRDDPGRTPLRVFVYFGSEARLATTPIHLGPIAEYTMEHARAYRDGDL